VSVFSLFCVPVCACQLTDCLCMAHLKMKRSACQLLQSVFDACPSQHTRLGCRDLPPECLMPPLDFGSLLATFPLLKDVSIRLLSRCAVGIQHFVLSRCAVGIQHFVLSRCAVGIQHFVLSRCAVGIQHFVMSRCAVGIQHLVLWHFTVGCSGWQVPVAVEVRSLILVLGARGNHKMAFGPGERAFPIRKSAKKDHSLPGFHCSFVACQSKSSRVSGSAVQASA